MTRNLKALGLALMALFALGTVVASAASAQQAFLTSDGPVTLTGTETGEKANRVTIFGGSIECPGTTWTGHKYNVTPHEPLEANATIITITPHYVNCSSPPLKFPSTINMNGCDYVLHLGETNGADSYSANSTVDCPEGKHISIKVTSGSLVCIITITEKEGSYPEDAYSGLSVTDTTNGDIDITGTLESIEATREGSLCAKASGSAQTHADLTIVGHNKAGAPTEIGISEEGETTNQV